jgi:hypothetical protein
MEMSDEMTIKEAFPILLTAAKQQGFTADYVEDMSDMVRYAERQAAASDPADAEQIRRAIEAHNDWARGVQAAFRNSFKI